MSNPQTPFPPPPQVWVYRCVSQYPAWSSRVFFIIANVQKQNYVQEYLQLNLGYSKIKWKPLIVPKQPVSGIV